VAARAVVAGLPALSCSSQTCNREAKILYKKQLILSESAEKTAQWLMLIH
jgi:hypothetical protein